MPLWSALIGDSDAQIVRSIDFDAAGHLYLAGSAGHAGEALLMKLTAEGAPLWSRGFAGIAADARALAARNGDVVVLGSSNTAVDWGGGERPVDEAALTYLARFDGEGAWKWDRIVGSGDELIGGFAEDSLGAIAVAGYFFEFPQTTSSSTNTATSRAA